MDKLAAMRAFVAIVEQGSLSAAAEALDRAPPTMVRTLAMLEQELGVRLLTRTTRRMALTEEGRVYLERCRAILAAVAEAEESVAGSAAEPRGTIRLTAPVLFGQWHVAPVATAFAKRHEQVQVELVLLDRIVDMVEERLDVGVRIGPLPDSSLVAVGVGAMRRVVVASPELLERLGEPEHPEALASAPCVGHSGTGPVGRWVFPDPAARAGGRGGELAVRIDAGFTANVATAAVEACAAGLGFGRFLAYQVDEAIRTGRLRVVLERFEPPPLPVQIVYPDARLMSPRLRVFVDFLREGLRGRTELRQAASSSGDPGAPAASSAGVGARPRRGSTT